MPIIDLQRRLQQVGRIRLGERVSPNGRPTRLERWKLTSRDQTRLEAAAAVFGGKVEPWEGHEGEFALHTETDNLPILLLPNQTISQAYELWSGGGCQRRCNGETEELSDGPCLCDPESRECKPHTRLSVMLPDVAGLGVWRLDSTGWYAAVELAGTVDLLEMATTKGVLLPARLRIDQRSVLRNGQTRKFPVPTLDIDVRPLEMHEITRSAVAGEIAAAPEDPPAQALSHTPVAALAAGVTLAEGLAAADKQTEQVRTARSAAPIGEAFEFEQQDAIPVTDTDLPPSAPTAESQAGGRIGTDHASEGDGSATAAAGTDEAPLASPDQQKLLMATAREAGIPDARRYDLTAQICGEGIRSVKRVPKDKVDELLAAFNAPDGLDLAGELFALGDELGIRQQVDAAFSQHRDDREWLERQIARLKERRDGSLEAVPPDKEKAGS